MQLSLVSDDDIAAARQIKYSPLLRRIVFEVAEVTGVPAGDIIGPSKARAGLMARDLVCFIARREGMTLTEIGRGIGRDHTTVMAAIKREAARRTCKTDDSVPD